MRDFEGLPNLPNNNYNNLRFARFVFWGRSIDSHKKNGRSSKIHAAVDLCGCNGGPPGLAVAAARNRNAHGRGRYVAGQEPPGRRGKKTGTRFRLQRQPPQQVVVNGRQDSLMQHPMERRFDYQSFVPPSKMRKPNSSDFLVAVRPTQ